jgi:hypothetical protein
MTNRAPCGPRTIGDDDVERVIVKTPEETLRDAAHWSTRSMGAGVGDVAVGGQADLAGVPSQAAPRRQLQAVRTRCSRNDWDRFAGPSQADDAVTYAEQLSARDDLVVSWVIRQRSASPSSCPPPEEVGTRRSRPSSSVRHPRRCDKPLRLPCPWNSVTRGTNPPNDTTERRT